MKKIVIYTFVILILLTLASRIPLVNYALMQGRGQYEIITGAVSFDQYLKSSGGSDEWKTKLRLIKEAITFAEETGLNTEKSYTKIYDQKGQNVLWNVSACEPYAFIPYRWHFPFLGSFSYKGFFDLAAAKVEASRLKDEALDVRIRPVGAWSTLGWFDDPLMSNQLNKSPGSIMETIFHELTHATIFYHDSLEYNENIASFIGWKMTIDFLSLKYGEKSEEMNEYLNSRQDHRLFRSHMFRGKEKLAEVYQSFDQNMTAESKDSLKYVAINEIISKLDTLTFQNERYGKLFEKTLPNNAYFMSLERYHGYHSAIDQIYKSFNNDLKKTIYYLKSRQD